MAVHIHNHKPAVVSGVLLSFTAFFAVGIQFYFAMQGYMDNNRTFGGALTDFFSFFTIQSNILAGLFMAYLSFSGKRDRFVTSAPAITAVAVYLIVVTLVYNLVLRQLWHPKGWERLADELLHVAVPTLYLLY